MTAKRRRFRQRDGKRDRSAQLRATDVKVEPAGSKIPDKRIDGVNSGARGNSRIGERRRRRE